MVILVDKDGTLLALATSFHFPLAPAALLAVFWESIHHAFSLFDLGLPYSDQKYHEYYFIKCFLDLMFDLI